MNKEQLVQLLLGADELNAAAIVQQALEGYAIVPVEPSAEMITAGMNGRIYCQIRSVVAETCEAYKAMLAAWEQE